MSFLDELKIVEEMGLLRFCEWININDDYNLSIQCGVGKYSFPRENIELDKYTHFEIAFIYEGLLSYNNHEELLEGFDRKAELKQHKEDTVYANVPKDLVEDLYGYLIESNNEKKLLLKKY